MVEGHGVGYIYIFVENGDVWYRYRLFGTMIVLEYVMFVSSMRDYGLEVWYSVERVLVI